jgi:DNA-binding NtrC family response regulator
MGMYEKAIGGGLQDARGRPGLKDLVEAYERALIQDALLACGGHQRRTAARLCILATTLHEKMKRLGLLRRRSGGEEVEVEPMGSREFGYSSMTARGREES